jgi:hypothetical protein
MDENSSNLFTKNLPGPLFEKHVNVFIGNGSDDLSNSSDSQGRVLEDRLMLLISHVESPVCSR